MRQENSMSSPQAAAGGARQAPPDGFDVLDECHRQTLFSLGKLAALVTRLVTIGADAEARTMAADLVQHFSVTVRRHHEDEERHVFPKLVAEGNEEVVHAVLRLQIDHDWLEENWMELSPQLDAVAHGLSWYDLAVLQEAAQVFIGLSHDHIALEESFIYPEAKARLDARERAGMGREMAARRRQALARSRG
jgi:hemerythrin-like domain-containing protein